LEKEGGSLGGRNNRKDGSRFSANVVITAWATRRAAFVAY